MTKEQYEALARRCEQAKGPSSELNLAIGDVLGVDTYYLRDWTGSLDAAMTLVGGNMLVALSDIHGDGLPGCTIVSDTSTMPVREHHGICFDGRNATREQKLALAICAAALRTSQREGEGE
jgi:hypothetical protein